MAKALHILMPRGYTGPAPRFTVGQGPASAGDASPIVLSTVGPPEAILLIRDRSPDYYDEGEVVVDPYRLGRVEVV
jgi:hypothetical protein